MTTTKDSSPNENCLEGWQCPDCKSWGPFSVEARCRIIVEDDGTDTDWDNGDVEWDRGSIAQCVQCDKTATVDYFCPCSGPCVAGLMPGETCEDCGQMADKEGG